MRRLITDGHKALHSLSAIAELLVIFNIVLPMSRVCSSSRMHVIYHNSSAMKQRPHPQSVAEISCENGSAETIVADGGRNLVAGLWGHTLGEN